MLDKSVPYVDILMRRAASEKPPSVPLPEGYRFSFFKAGDEADWARIETSVLEFDCEMDALLYFQREFLPYLSELGRRCLFIEAPDGEKVATCTAWWGYSGVRRDPWLHWLSVKPGHQGKRLGKALVAEILRLMTDIEGARDFYLHTQTWSHKAVRIYQAFGFQITDEPNLSKYSNENHQKAVAVLESIYHNA